MLDIGEKLQNIKDNNLYRDIKYLSKSQDKFTTIDGKDVLLMASNNYLGLCNNEEVKNAAIEALQIYGLGSGGSRLTTGSYDIHRELEENIAKFKQTESALLFNTGYMANIGVISSLCDEESYIFSDELNHASIIDGCKLSKGKVIVYKHNDMKDLSKKIGEIKPKKGMIITDGVFSMDGDVAHVDEIVKIARKYNLFTMVDDAHATGVIGETGRGSGEYFNCNIDITVGTLSKAIGSEGGFVCGNKEVIEYLRNKARSFIFSTALSPTVISGANKSLEIIDRDHRFVKKLSNNIDYLCHGLKDIGFDVHSITPIIPIIIGSEELAIEFSKRLFEEGVYIPAIRFPTVKKGEARLRMTIMSTHDYRDIDFVLEKIKKVKNSLCM